MSQLRQPARISSDGPYLPGASPARENLKLFGLLLPALLLGLPLRGEAFFSAHLANLGLLWGAALLVFLPGGSARKRLADLDWLVCGALAWLLLYSFSASAGSEARAYLLCGGFCGLLTRLPFGFPLLKAPALIPFLAVVLTWLSFGLFQKAFRQELFIMSWGKSGWLGLAALAAAGLCFVADRKSWRHLVFLWLAALASLVFLPPALNLDHLDPFRAQGISRLFALSAAAFFIIPQMAFGRAGLLSGEAILIAFMATELTFFWGEAIAPALNLAGWVDFSQPPAGALLFDAWPALAVAAALTPSIILWFLRELKRPGPNPEAPQTSPGRARLACGHDGQAPLLAAWRGLPSCRLAAEHDEGSLNCPYGCLGLGDCARLCPYGAIKMEGGFPRRQIGLCRGCGLCREICPKKLWSLESFEGRAFIACSARSPLKINADYCPQACLGCGRCKKACSAGAIDRQGPYGAMKVDQKICREYGQACGRACAEVCPRNLIKKELS